MLSQAHKEVGHGEPKWWARKAVRQAIELGERAHSETASEECTDAFLLFARVLEKLSPCLQSYFVVTLAFCPTQA
jgi:hypothetical protein